MRLMQSSRSRMLPWIALAAIALLAVAAVPHGHDEGEGHEEQGEHCPLCHVQEAPIIASSLSAHPDPAVRSAAVPVAVAPAHGITPTGGGSRAPPA